MTISKETDEFLEHFGVKGMRWGVRKPGTGRASARMAKASDDHKETLELRKKSRPELSNKEIQTINTRLNLEQNYKRLAPSTIQKGRHGAKEILATAALVGSLAKLVTTDKGKATIDFGLSKIISRKRPGPF